MKIKAVFYAGGVTGLPYGHLVGVDVRALRACWDTRDNFCIRGGYADGTAFALAPGVYTVAGRFPLTVVAAHDVADKALRSWVPAGCVRVDGLLLPWSVVGLFDVYGSSARLWRDFDAGALMRCGLVVPGVGRSVVESAVLVRDTAGRLGLLMGRFASLPLVAARPIIG